jgi:MYXO-CTERM domain-containing protein
MRLGDMRKALVACAVLAAPFAAQAQFVLTSPQALPINNQQPQIFIGKKNCSTQSLSFHWDLTNIGGLAAGQVVNIAKVHNASECSSTAAPTGAGETLTPAPSQNTTGDDVVTAQSMILDPNAGLPGGCDNKTITSAAPWTTFYCVQVSSTSAFTGSSVIFEDIQINYALAPPTPPAQVTVFAGDGHLKVSWAAGNPSENIDSYDVHVLAPDGGAFASPARNVKDQLNADVTQTDTGDALKDGTTYRIFVVANDRYGNQSDLSPEAAGTPVQVLDFYGLYRQDGGNSRGGCSSTGPGTWVALLALASGLFIRRRKKLQGGAALVALFALVAPKAQAETYKRPDRFLLVAVKVDRYDPKVDSEAGLTGNPYHQTFGPRAPLRWQVEADWEVWHPFGSLLIGGTVGYWQNFGKGRLAGDVGTRSDDTALLDVIPIGLILTYRFDYLADLYPRFPLIPYVQGGLMRAFWASFNGVGDISRDPTGQGGHGSGWTPGYTTAVGVAIALDAIDPDLSREAYQDTGIQRSSVFAEYGWTRLDGFRSGRALILSDRAFRFGVAIEF